jgi:cob(I)alamin adenosyltransferase
MIYTKTGDKGQTSLANGQRVAKTDVRIEAYGTVDELNAWVGMLRAAYNDDQLDSIQNKLFNLGAELSQASGEWISESDVKQLESWIDAMQSVVPPQRAFILPMGSEPVVRCHVCRTICRRAERRMIEAEASPESLRFINRLSDYFFVLSRYIAYQHKEEEYVWKK